MHNRFCGDGRKGGDRRRCVAVRRNPGPPLAAAAAGTPVDRVGMVSLETLNCASGALPVSGDGAEVNRRVVGRIGVALEAVGGTTVTRPLSVVDPAPL